MLKLVTPQKQHRQQAKEYLQEFREHQSPVHGAGGLDRYEDYSEWLRKLSEDLDFDNIPPERVPANTYFAVSETDGRIVGMVNIRHRLNEYLLKEGGHIGYAVRPSERRNGFATEMLALGLKVCERLGIEKILVCCDKNNTASARVIQKNGGILENEIEGEHLAEIVQRYWIDMKQA